MRDATKIIRSILALPAPRDPMLSSPVLTAAYYILGDASDASNTYALDAAR